MPSRIIIIVYLSIAVWHTSCTGPLTILSDEDSSTAISTTELSADESLEAVISPMRDEMSRVMDEVLCDSEADMSKARPESKLGNWVSDLCLDIARAESPEPIHAAIFNHGGLRASIAAGPVTRGDVYSLMPFDNELVVVTLDREAMLLMRDYLVERAGEPVSDIELIIDGDDRAGSFKIKGEELGDGPYRILTSDYLADGGDNMDFLTKEHRSDIRYVDLKVRDAILQRCEELGEESRSIVAKTDGRIRYEQK